ncbi:MAG: hypothetical protein HYU37_19190 [Acidobacteria bacterium]|nr:hypothetical protein [Acidobacteriota bacterium]
MRDHTRPTPDRSTPVSESQAGELTLTVSEAAVRPIQVWVRTAGLRDAARQVLTAYVPAPDAAFVEVGQRARAFSPDTRSRMYQARIAAVYVPQGGGRYAPRAITTGVQGELFTQVLEGVHAGEQVVTIGSFFIDAEHTLKSVP